MMSIKNILSVIALSCAAFASVNNAQAQSLTRNEVRQQLIQAENSGSHYVTDASYPDISPNYQNQISKNSARKSDEAMGPDMSGSTQSGATLKDSCVGPVSFCNIYFGSWFNQFKKRLEKRFIMRYIKSIVLPLILASTEFAFISSASAEDLTRAQVLADLVRVEQAGYRPGGDDVNYPADIQAAEQRIAAQDASSATLTSAQNFSPSVTNSASRTN
jgi:hypothetical protein